MDILHTLRELCFLARADRCDALGLAVGSKISIVSELFFVGWLASDSVAYLEKLVSLVQQEMWLKLVEGRARNGWVTADSAV